MKKIRILIADDHSVVRSGIRMVLQSSPEFVVVAEAENGQDAVELAAKMKPDVVVMDISMPVMNGIEATGAMKQNNPDIKVIILTVHADEEYVFQILRAGASGYVLKSAGKKEIFAAIRAAVSGERFFSPGISNLIIDGFINRAREQTAAPAPPAKNDPRQQLTNREIEVLTFIAQGLTNRKIADTLFLSVRTVNTHRTNLMQKLGIHDTATLVRYAIETGLVKINA
ncbi:MAG: response regulator transcription factor [Ignavibacteriae bacterium]|nr:response regulator transcription factor [Ignavibacteriota bacterium]